LGGIYYITYHLVRILNLFSTKLWSVNLTAAGNQKKELTGHPVGSRALKRLGLMDGYISFCRKHNFVSHGCYNSMKCWYIASILNKQILTKENVNIIEIGGGVRNLASIMLDKLKINQYFIVDLPEMILNSSMAIHALYPELPIHFLAGDDAEQSLDKPGIYFCPPESINRIPSDYFDLGINIDSFQEMNESQVEEYLKLIQRVCKQGATFVNLNRRKF